MTRRRTLAISFAAAALLVCTAAANAAVQLGTSGWNWSDPQPQGHDLLDVAASDATHAFAAGANGTVLSTADAGATWSSIPTALDAVFKRVGTVGGSVLVSGNCVVRRSDDGGATLTRLPFIANENSCLDPVAASAFQSPTSGLLMLDSGTVLATDNGTSFSRRTAVPGTGLAGTATDLVMISPTTGFATTSTGTIARTVNRASSWETVLTAGSPITSITFADATTAYAVAAGAGVYSPSTGAGPGIFKSVDAGLTWTRAGFSGASNLERIRCGSANVCVITKSDGSGIYRTTDGGSSFTLITPASVGIRGIAFLSPTRVIGVGDKGTTVASDDAGATWQQVGHRLPEQMTGLRANADGFAYAWGAAGGFATTSDRGATWRALGVPTSNPIRTISFATPEIGYAVDLAGTVLRTTDGGLSWQILDIGDEFKARNVIAVTPTRFVLLDGAGNLVRSADGGQTFRASGTAATRRFAFTAHRAGPGIVAAGPRGLAISTNAGASWRVVPGPRSGRAALTLRSVRCPSAVVCWAVTSGRRLFRTVNGGRAWTELTANTGGLAIDDVAPTSRRVAYLTVDGSFPPARSFPTLLRTTDGGGTWNPQGTDRELKIVSSSGIDYAIDPAGDLFTTTSGGVSGAPSVVTVRASTPTIRGRTKVTLTGKLTPAVQGAQVVVSSSDRGQRTVTVAANGRFTATFTISRTTTFVAQWGGDRTRAGDGSPAVTIRRR